MNPKDLTQLSNEELIQEQKKLKSSKITNAVLIGIFLGISVYSAIRNGLGFFTFFPLIFAYILFNNGKKTKAIENEIQSRNLK